MNRLAQKKELEIADAYHTTNLKSIRAMNKQFNIVYDTILINRVKSTKLKEVRDLEITRENKALNNRLEIIRNAAISVLTLDRLPVAASTSSTETGRKNKSTLKTEYSLRECRNARRRWTE